MVTVQLVWICVMGVSAVLTVTQWDWIGTKAGGFTGGEPGLARVLTRSWIVAQQSEAIRRSQSQKKVTMAINVATRDKAVVSAGCCCAHWLIRLSHWSIY
ncbi:MAG: hypothetical protein JO331_04680 [Verrucomicrobia bacterium]|nr:hypothetical protein [Verrucomicrobiota bacterium]